MAQITWRNVSAPSFRGNAANVAAIRSIGDAFDKANIFKQISQDRSDAFDTATQTEKDAFQRESDILTNDRIKQQMGLALTQDARAAEESRLSNQGTQFTLDNNQAVLDDRFLTSEAQRTANAASATASNARTNLNNFNLNTARTTQEEQDQIKSLSDTVTKAKLDNPNMPEAELQELARTTAASLGNPGIAIAGYNTAVNALTAPTNADVLEAEAAKATKDFEQKKELVLLKNKGKDLDLSDIMPTVTGTVGNFNPLNTDSVDQNRFIATVNSVTSQGLSNPRIKALAAKYIESDGDFNEEGFLAEAALLIDKK